MFVNHHHQSLAKATERPEPSEVNPEPEPKESRIASEYGIGKINNGGNSNVPSTGISHDAGAISSVWPTSENLKALVPKMNDKDPSPNLDDCSIVIERENDVRDDSKAKTCAANHSVDSEEDDKVAPLPKQPFEFVEDSDEEVVEEFSQRTEYASVVFEN